MKIVKFGARFDPAGLGTRSAEIEARALLLSNGQHCGVVLCLLKALC